MAGFGHESVAPQVAEPPELSARNAGYGLLLFAVYLVLYGGYVLLNAFAPDVMGWSLAGVGLAVWYGLVLIVAAMVLALIYCQWCRAPLAP